LYEMRIYLLNNTQPYRDDEDEGYTGGWFNCPVDLEEVRERLGVENEEQLEIADYELPFEVHSEMPLWEINVKCRMVQEMEGTPIGNEMKSIIQRWFYGFDEFIDHKDEIRYYDVADGAALAEYLICEEWWRIYQKIYRTNFLNCYAVTAAWRNFANTPTRLSTIPTATI
jgi:hypothetical protein